MNNMRNLGCLHHCPHHLSAARMTASKSLHFQQSRAIRVSAKRKKGQDINRKGKDQAGDAAGRSDVDALGGGKECQGHRESNVVVGEEQDPGVQLSKSGKPIGWKLFPRDEESGASTTDAMHEAQQEVSSGWGFGHTPATGIKSIADAEQP